MGDEKKEQEPITVVDRRRFTSEGQRRPDAEATPTAASEASAAPAPDLTPPPPPSPGAKSQAGRRTRPGAERQPSPRHYKVDFETLVISLSTSAMYQLGLVEDPARGRLPADFEGARQTIDMLAVIQEKTRGNLTPQEERLVEQALYELRLAYSSLADRSRSDVPEAGSQQRSN